MQRNCVLHGETRRLVHMAKSSTKAGVIAALEYISHPEKYPPSGTCAVFGDDEFLKAEVLGMLRQQALGAGDAELGLTTFTGQEVLLRDIRDALSSLSLFGDGRRMAIVEDADSFVTEYRQELEDYVAAPARGVLVLDVKTWPGNTRLAKAVAATGLTVDCKTPDERSLRNWLIARSKSVHQVTLEKGAVDALFELVPPETGLLAQELAKLAIVVDQRRMIDVDLVRTNVGSWRTRAVWDVVDAVAEGRAADALAQLDRLIASGEKPQGLLPQMGSSLRRFATAINIIESAERARQRIAARDALAQAGVPPFKLSAAENQLRQLGRQRAKQITERLLAADLAMKGHHSSDDRARTEIERIIVQLSKSAPRTAAVTA